MPERRLWQAEDQLLPGNSYHLSYQCYTEKGRYRLDIRKNCFLRRSGSALEQAAQRGSGVTIVGIVLGKGGLGCGLVDLVVVA